MFLLSHARVLSLSAAPFIRTLSFWFVCVMPPAPRGWENRIGTRKRCPLVSPYFLSLSQSGNLGLSRDPFLHVTACIAARHQMWCVNQNEERKRRFEIIKGETLVFPCLSPITCHGCLRVTLCVSGAASVIAWLWLCAADTWVSCLTLSSIHLCFSTVKSLSCVVCMQSPHVNSIMSIESVTQ